WSQPGTCPAPAHLMESAPDRSTRKEQVKALGEESGEQGHTPARLDMAGAGWRLAGLGIDDGSSQRIPGWASTAGFIFQAGYSLTLIAMQPDPHHILAAVMDGGDLGNGEAAVGEQDHVGAQSHTSDGLPTDDLQFV